MGTEKFDIRYDRWCAWLLGLLGSGPRFSHAVVTDESLELQLGFAFRSVVSRSAITSVRRWQGRVLGWGAHGWRGRWLVNGSSHGIVVFQIDPPAIGRVLGVPVTVRELAVSLEDPEGLCAELCLDLTGQATR